MKRRATLWLLATIAIVFATYAPQLGANFELQDDHRIIAPLVHPYAASAGAWYLRELALDFEVAGRFRPVNQCFDVFGPHLLGPNPLLWHALSLVLAVAVAVLLFHAALAAYGSPPAASVFALITLLAPDPGPTTVWYRLGPKEAWGMLFLAAALVVIARKGNAVLAFILVALCAYSKEPFVLLVPALFGIRVWIARRRPRGEAVAYAVLFALGLAGIAIAVLNAGAQSYGAQSLAISPQSIAGAVAKDVARAPMLAAWFVPAVLAFAKRRRVAIFPLVLFVAWVAPQYALYASRGGFWDHYWLPCVVAFAAVNAAAVAVLEKEPRRFLYRLAMAAAAIWTINAVRIDAVAVLNFKEKARVQQEAVRVAAAGARPGSILLIVADAKEQAGEVAPSFADFVRARGGRYSKALLYDWRCTTACVPREFQSGTAVPVDPGAIAVVAHIDEDAPPISFGDAFQRTEIIGKRRYLSLRQRGLVTIPFRLRVDVRRP